MPVDEIPQTKMTRWRRRLIAAALLPLGVCVIAFVYVGRDSSRVQMVSDLGGSLSWTYAGPKWPWLEQAFYRFSSVRGTPMLGRLTGVRLDDTAADDATIERLGDLRSVHRLSLRRTRVTDVGIEMLDCPNLWHLHVDGTRVTDRSLAHMATFPMLRDILLAGTPISDRGLEKLAMLQSLSNLVLTGTAVSDEGLWHVRHRTTLIGLRLEHTQITDTGLGHLSKMTGLSTLCLGGTAVTDSGMEVIRQFGQLAVLDLSRTSVSDTGLLHLYGLSSLRDLDLRGTHVTADGVAAFKEQHEQLRRKDILYRPVLRVVWPK